MAKVNRVIIVPNHIAIADSSSLKEDGSVSSIATSVPEVGETQIFVPGKLLPMEQQKLKLE